MTVTARHNLTDAAVEAHYEDWNRDPQDDLSADYVPEPDESAEQLAPADWTSVDTDTPW